MADMETIDRLYGLPIAEFTQARNQAASELRRGGQREAADRVKALRKPTAAAAAVNLLVRQHRGEVERFLRTAAMLRDAQVAGKGDLAAASRKEREALEQLTRLGGKAVRQSLLAAAVDDDAARQLLEARLERELESRGFGTLLAHAPAAPKPKQATAGTRTPEGAPGTRTPEGAPAPRARPAPPEEKKPDDSAARARLLDAKTALGAAEAEERRARRQWERTQKELGEARAAVAEAQRDLGAPTP